jgi:hypothetical protein
MMGALPPRPRDLTLLGKHRLQNGRHIGRPQPCLRLSRRSGSIPGEPYPPLSYQQPLTRSSSTTNIPE